MTPVTPSQQLMAAFVACAVAFLGGLAVLAPAIYKLVGALVASWTEKLRNSVADRGVAAGKELRAATGATGADAKELASKIYKASFPKATDAEVDAAIQSAVGIAPGVGASGRATGEIKIADPAQPPPLPAVQS